MTSGGELDQTAVIPIVQPDAPSPASPAATWNGQPQNGPPPPAQNGQPQNGQASTWNGQPRNGHAAQPELPSQPTVPASSQPNLPWSQGDSASLTAALATAIPAASVTPD